MPNQGLQEFLIYHSKHSWDEGNKQLPEGFLSSKTVLHHSSKAERFLSLSLVPNTHLLFPLRSSRGVLSPGVFCPKMCFPSGCQSWHSSTLIFFPPEWCCVMLKVWDFSSAWGEKNFSVKLCHLLKYSTPLNPLLLKSKQWGMKYSCKEVGVRKTGFTSLRSNWWWQCAISVFATLKFFFSWLLKQSTCCLQCAQCTVYFAFLLFLY